MVFNTLRLWRGSSLYVIARNHTNNNRTDPLSHANYACQPSSDLWNGKSLSLQICDDTEVTQYREYQEWDESMTVSAPLYYPAGSAVLFTFHGVDYGRPAGSPLDLSVVTFQGQSPVAWSEYYRTVSFLVSMSGGETFTLDADSPSGPGTYADGTKSTSICGSTIETRTNANWLSFDGFDNCLITMNSAPDKVAIGKTITLSLASACGGSVLWTGTDNLTIVGANDGSACTFQAHCKEGSETLNARVTFPSGATLDLPKTVEVKKPTAETSTSVGHETITYGTPPVVHPLNHALFDAHVYPDDIDFSGLYVNEKDGGGGSENCRQTEDDPPPFNILPSMGPWPIDSNNLYGEDTMGWDTAKISYYRSIPGRTPCNNSLTQIMYVICDGDEIDYNSHPVEMWINPSTLCVERGGAPHTWDYP